MEWIACSIKMPPNDDYVLAADFVTKYPSCMPNYQVGCYGDWIGSPEWDDGDGNGLHLKCVTHWMPLPEPPSE